MNLKKYTKAELISKIQGLKTNPTFQSKLFDYIYLIKQFLVKITFLTLILKIFKRFKILRRIWLILNTIVMSIFGISMLDIYGLTFLSAFITEITEITGNIVNYLTNTKFYGIISGLLGYKVETIKDTGKLSTINKSSTGNETSNKEISRVTEWFNKEEIVEDNTPFYKNKYFIIGSFLLISGLTYYYFGDEVKTYGITLWELIRRRRPGDDNPNGTNGNNMNPVSSFFGLNRNNGLFSQFVSGEDSTDAIEVINETTKTERIEKAVSFVDQKKPFTSPSLDNLNESVKDGWTKSRPTSPESVSSVSSSSTIKPSSLPKIKVDTNASSSYLPPGNPLPVTPEGYIDEALTPISNHLKPFVDVEEINGNLHYVYNEDNWKSSLNQGIQDRMNWIETFIANENIKDLDKYQDYKLKDKVTDVLEAYRVFTKAYGDNRDNFDNETSQPLKYFGYLMRQWLQKHLQLIWPDEVINIPIGNKLDSPLNINKDIFDIQAHLPNLDSDSDSE